MPFGSASSAPRQWITATSERNAGAGLAIICAATHDDGAHPHPARVLDFLRGGSAHGPADRAAAARRAAAGAVVVHAEHDDEVRDWSRGVLAAQAGGQHGDAGHAGSTAVLPGSLDDPDAVLDLSQPVGVLLRALHRVTDDGDAACRVRALTDMVAPGSCLALAHPAPHGRAAAEDLAWESVEPDWRSVSVRRTRERVAALLPPEAVPLAPGLVPLPDWRPPTRREPPPAGADALPSAMWCGAFWIPGRFENA